MVCFPHQHVGPPEDGFFYFCLVPGCIPRLQGCPGHGRNSRTVQGMLNEMMVPGKSEAHQVLPVPRVWAPGPPPEASFVYFG